MTFFVMIAVFAMLMRTGVAFYFCAFFPVFLYVIVRAFQPKEESRMTYREEVQYRPQPEAPPIIVQEDERLHKIQSLHDSLTKVIQEHKVHPIVQATGDDIKREADELRRDIETRYPANKLQEKLQAHRQRASQE